MKALYVLFFTLCFLSASAQTWMQKQNSPDCRYDGAAFSIGNLIYYGAGITCSGNHDNSFFVFDPSTNSWDTIASLPGATRRMPFAFALNGKGYVGMGIAQTGNALNDVWEYNPSTNSWTQKNNFPFTGRGACFSTATATKGYIGAGLAYMQFFADYYEYDAIADAWTAQPSFMGGIRFQGSSFAIGGFTYAMCGLDNNGTTFNDVWMFDTLLNQWSACAAIPGPTRTQASAFAINGKGYCGYGGYADFYEYDPAGNSWSPIADNNDGQPSYDCAVATSTAGYCMDEYASAPDCWEFLPGTAGIIATVTNEWTVLSNPSSDGLFVIQFANEIPEELRITDINGKVISPPILRRERELVIDLSHYESGMYLLQICAGISASTVRLIRLK